MLNSQGKVQGACLASEMEETKQRVFLDLVFLHRFLTALPGPRGHLCLAAPHSHKSSLFHLDHLAVRELLPRATVQ